MLVARWVGGEGCAGKANLMLENLHKVGWLMSTIANRVIGVAMNRVISE